MNSNKLSKLFLAVLSSAVMLQTAAFAFTLEELEARERLHHAVRESSMYETASRTKQLSLQPFIERDDAFRAKVHSVESAYDRQIHSLEKSLKDSQAYTDGEIAKLKQESDANLALRCAPLYQEREAAETAFQQESTPLQTKISAILQAQQERQARESSYSRRGSQSEAVDPLDEKDSALRAAANEKIEARRAAAENKEMALLNEKIEALREHHLGRIDGQLERAKSTRYFLFETDIDPLVTKHRNLETEIMARIQRISDERANQVNALKASNAAFDDEFTKRSTQEYLKLNEAYHLAKRKLLPQYPALRGFLDSADRAAAQQAPAAGGAAAQ